MTSFETLQSISSRLNELTNQLSSIKLSKEELEEFETLSRKLYERAVILSYKSKEESVYGKTPKEALANTFTSSEEDRTEEDNTEEEPEISDSEIDTNVSHHETVVEEEEEPEVEESMEDLEPAKSNSPSDGRVEFDFSSGFDTPKKEVAEEPISQPEPEVEIPESYQVEDLDEVEDIEEAHFEEESTTQKEEHQPSLDEMLQGTDDKTASFYEQFSKAHKATAGDRLGTSKIDSLKGAIGLNDKLQFINELFGNNSGAYNETIDLLDQLEDNKEALLKLSEIAVEENWHEDSSTVNEFVHLINRRYVD